MKLLIVDPTAPPLLDAIERHAPQGHTLEMVPTPGDDDFARMAADADVLLVLSRRIDARTLAMAPRARFAQRFGVGYDNMDLEACRAAGVLVAYTPGGNAGAVAEHTVMLILAAMRRAGYAAHAVRHGLWPAAEMLASRVPDLDGATVGLVGLGAIGRALAQRLGGFGCRLRYTQRHRLDPAAEAALGVVYQPFDELLAGSDVVSVQVPLTDETRRLFGAAAFARMRPGAFFVNTSRGDVVDEPALYDAVASGHLGGAGLDVIVDERPGGNPFADLPNVVVTPHYGGGTVGARARIVAMAMENVARFANGQTPRYLVP